MQPSHVIVDYGVGNLGSIQNMLRHLGIPSVISRDPKVIEGAHKLLLPGVGAFQHAMMKLQESGLIPHLEKKVHQEKTPLLGICVGMQLLSEFSEEGNVAGLGWVPGKVVRFRTDGHPEMKVPHMGWNQVIAQRENAYFSKDPGLQRFYFVHSFHFEAKNREDILGVTRYFYDFTAAVQKDNILGVQFHPEKSHKYGMELMKKFFVGSGK